MELFIKYLLIYFFSGIKFIAGPTLGNFYQINWIITSIFTIMGMMTVVYLLTYFSHFYLHLLKFFRKKNKKIFSKTSRRYVRIWRKYGVKGIAFLTPLMLMPWLGTLLANILGGKKKDIIFWMWISAIFWGFSLSYLLKNAFWVVRGVLPF